MLAILLGLFQLIWLFGRGHHAIALENLALRQQLAIYKRKKKRPRQSDPIAGSGSCLPRCGKTGGDLCS